MDLTTYDAMLFDVDKTLTNSQRVIADETKEAIKSLERNHFTLGMCTGRHFGVLHRMNFTFFPSNSFHVVSGGAQIVKNDGEIVWEQCLSSDVALEIALWADQEGYPLDFQNGSNFYGNESDKELQLSRGYGEIKDYRENQNWNLPILTIYKINENFLNFLSTKKNIAYKKMTSYSGFPYVDITPIGVNKATALKEWSKITGIQLDRVIGFGDSENDIEFLQTVGWGVAMGNATEEVKNIADEVTLSCDANGVAAWITTHL